VTTRARVMAHRIRYAMAIESAMMTALWKGTKRTCGSRNMAEDSAKTRATRLLLCLVERGGNVVLPYRQRDGDGQDSKSSHPRNVGTEAT